MPSQAKQGAVVIKNKNPKKPGSYLLISKKTGFIDVSVNNQRFYYNASLTNQSMSQKNITRTFIEQNSPAKKTIIISRKSS